MKDWLILLCIGIIALLAFREREHWLSRRETPVMAVAPEAASPNPAGRSLKVDPSVPGSPANTELAELVAQSQRAAVAKYPALASANSEINIRFNYRCKLLLEEHSPRLQDPAWPVRLADECARDSGVRPVVTPSTGTPPPNLASAPASMPPPAPGAAQTLVFHPAAAGISPLPATLPAGGATAPKRPDALPFVTMDAVNKNSGNHFVYNWRYDYGWYDISFRQSVGIDINLRNMSRSPAALNLRWIFFARNTANNARFVFATSGKELDLAPGQTASVTADSPMIQSREVNYGWIGDRYLSGSKYEGWLVQLLERGSNRVIKQNGSTSYLEDLAKRTDLSALVEEYRTKLHGPGGA